MSFAIDIIKEKELPEYEQISALTGVKYDYGYKRSDDDDRDDDRDEARDDDKDEARDGSKDSAKDSDDGAPTAGDDSTYEGTEQNDYIVSSGERDKIECKAGDDAVVNQGGRKKVVETGEGQDVYALDVSAMAKKGKTILRDFQSGIDKVALDVDGKTKVRGYGSNKLTITSGKKTHTIKSKEDAFDQDDVDFV
jgi:hypothetical protein